VIEISHAAALAGGVTAGDTSGYPVTLSAPGSYVLTSDLTVPDVNTSGIEVTTVDIVVIDLNGFAIRGSNTCTGCPVTSCTGGSGRGVYNTGTTRGIGIREGSIQGMGSLGVDITGNAELERVLISSNGGRGARVAGALVVREAAFGNNGGDGVYMDPGFPGLVHDSLATCNLDEGMELGTGCTVTNNTTLSNGGDGIAVQNGSTVTGNTVVGNVGIGILGFDGVTVLGNTVRLSLNLGMYLTGTGGFGNNVFTCNNSAGACTNGSQVLGGLPLGTNVCGTDTSCP
jgi:parallel beta-helix repeat protein